RKCRPQMLKGLPPLGWAGGRHYMECVFVTVKLPALATKYSWLPQPKRREDIDEGPRVIGKIVLGVRSLWLFDFDCVLSASYMPRRDIPAARRTKTVSTCGLRFWFFGFALTHRLREHAAIRLTWTGNSKNLIVRCVPLPLKNGDVLLVCDPR